MNNRIVKSVLGAMVVIAGLLGAVGSAQAGIVTGDFDPPFTAPLSPNQWNGKATFLIPNNTCFSLAAGPHAGGACAGTVLGATVYFYDGSNVLQETLSFSWTSDAITSVLISGLAAPNEVAGVTTGFSDVQSSSYFYYWDFRLEFDSSLGAVLEGTNTVCEFSCTQLFYADKTAYETPEPDSMLLMLAALAGVFGVSRRRRA